VTHSMRPSRADKTTVQIDVKADDALDCAVRGAVEQGIEAISSHGTIPFLSTTAALSEARVNDRRVLNDTYLPYGRSHRGAIGRKSSARTPYSPVALFTGVDSRIVNAHRRLALRRP
jgi:hypothetical protein